MEDRDLHDCAGMWERETYMTVLTCGRERLTCLCWHVEDRDIHDSADMWETENYMTVLACGRQRLT